MSLELLVEDGEEHDGNWAEDDIVELVDPLLIQGLPWKSALKPVPELGHHEEYVLVEDVDNQVRVFPVTLSAVHEE